MTDCAALQRALASRVQREFGKPRGFRKSGMTLRKVTQGEPFGAVLLLNVQGSQGNTGRACRVYLNASAFVTGISTPEPDPQKLKEYQCPFRARVGGDWELREGVDEGAVAAVLSEGAAWFEAHSDPLASLRRLEAEQSVEELAQAELFRTLCPMWCALGEGAKAAALLQARLDYLARERPRASLELVRTFGASLGLALA